METISNEEGVETLVAFGDGYGVVGEPVAAGGQHPVVRAVQGVIGIDGRGIDRQRNLHVGRHLARGGDGDAHGRRTVDVHVGDVSNSRCPEIDHVEYSSDFWQPAASTAAVSANPERIMIEISYPDTPTKKHNPPPRSPPPPPPPQVYFA